MNYLNNLSEKTRAGAKAGTGAGVKIELQDGVDLGAGKLLSKLEPLAGPYFLASISSIWSTKGKFQ